MLQHALGVGLVQLGAFHYGVAQHQATIAGKINIDHFDVGIDVANVVLPRQFAANPTIAALIMDRIDQNTFALLRIVMQMKQP